MFLIKKRDPIDSLRDVSETCSSIMNYGLESDHEAKSTSLLLSLNKNLPEATVIVLEGCLYLTWL